ncbi:hypothetical protein Sjap_005834 [Stephania japonica]|uniref:non-specific serine/threonine protein kinase n=1 Tax=Stephania japonica TaxID=461633 RepID=A0AAP0PM94_9MAGN
MSLGYSRRVGGMGHDQGSWYLAPQYAKNGIVSVRTDVYAYGVVLLQLISRRKLFELHREEQDQALKQWVCQEMRRAMEPLELIKRVS